MPKFHAKPKNRLPPFVPLLIATLDAPAWKAMSPGARILYLALKRHVQNGRNRAYLSHRDAAKETGLGRSQIGVWFAELRHYGFIALAQHGCLGIDGKGKAPHWRLTELGQTPRVSIDQLPEPPTRDFQKWDGTKFKTPSRRASHCVPSWKPPLSRRASHPKVKVSRRASHTAEAACPVVQAITSYHSTADEAADACPAPADAATDWALRKRKLAWLHRWREINRRDRSPDERLRPSIES